MHLLRARTSLYTITTLLSYPRNTTSNRQPIFKLLQLSWKGFFFLINFLEREGKRNIALLFYLFMHSLADSCTCPDQASNMQPWHIRQCSNQLSYPTRAEKSFLKSRNHSRITHCIWLLCLVGLLLPRLLPIFVVCFFQSWLAVLENIPQSGFVWTGSEKTQVMLTTSIRSHQDNSGT